MITPLSELFWTTAGLTIMLAMCEKARRVACQQGTFSEAMSGLEEKAAGVPNLIDSMGALGLPSLLVRHLLAFMVYAMWGSAVLCTLVRFTFEFPIATLRW